MQLLVDYLMQELDPDNTGGVTKARLMGTVTESLLYPGLSSCPSSAAATHSEDVKKRVEAIRLSLQRQVR